MVLFPHHPLPFESFPVYEGIKTTGDPTPHWHIRFESFPVYEGIKTALPSPQEGLSRRLKVSLFTKGLRPVLLTG